MRRMINRAALFTLIFIAALVALLQLNSVPVRSQKTVVEQPAKHASVEIPEATKQQVVVAYGKLPLRFEANQGQTDSRVKFLSRGSGYTLFLTSTEAVLALRSPRAKPSAADHGAATRPEPPAQRDVLRIRLVGANPALQMTGLDALPGKSNYFIGKDPQKWRRNVPHYAKVNYEEVYPDIDLVFYGNQRRLEYDFVVAPGADPGAIALGFEGADRLEIDPQGDLVVRMAGGEVRFQKPVVYQELDGARHIVPGSYALKSDDRVGFQVAAYDASKPLIIDPVLAYSTYLGGSDVGDGRAIAVDSFGNAYVAGSTKSTDFPITTDAVQQVHGGGYDVFVAKVNADGSALVYSTFLGGTQHAFAIAVDADGNAYVTGLTGSADSTNFPTTAGAFQVTPNGGDDAFVTVLNPTGTDLLYSTYLGGSGTDRGLGIAVKPGCPEVPEVGCNAYVTGDTYSTDFPTKNPFQADKSGASAFTDAFVAVIDPASNGLDALVFSTYLGGEFGDLGLAVAVDIFGNVYVTGAAYSNDFPTTAGAFDTNCGDDFDDFDCSHDGNLNDAFVAKLNPAGNGLDALVFSTYLGGARSESGEGIAMDSFGNVYVTGGTTSTDFPTTTDAVQQIQGGGGDVFMVKTDPSQSGAAFLIYSTYLGGEFGEGGSDIAVDADGNAYVTGGTSSTDFPTEDPIQANNAGNVDAFVAKLNPAGNGFTDLLFSTYLGGESTDGGMGIAVDADGNAYVTGRTWSTDFPTTEGAFQTNLGGTDSNKRRGPKFKSTSVGSDAFIVKIAEGPVGITLTATGYKVKGLQKADLAWSGATSANVDIYRNGGLIMTTENDGFYTDNIDQKGGATYTYQVCEEGTSICSNESTVTF